RVKLHNAQSQILYELDEVLLRGGASGALDRVGRICSARSAASGFVLVVFDGIDSRTLADGLRGALVCVPRDALPKVDDGEFYVHDIMGAQVVLVGGEPIGEVVDFISYPSTDVLVVKGSARYEIPMVDDFVRDVDAKNRVVIVDNVEDFRVD
ncbi:MAG: ribosome maturation factor RimM, partial [Polyangiaceae bacterium]|nr:ribosome maturation factor RimM [Polyangiaceae bacterium]